MYYDDEVCPVCGATMCYDSGIGCYVCDNCGYTDDGGIDDNSN